MTLISIFQKMRIKNMRRVSEVRIKKLDSFTLETSKNHLIRNFLRNGRVRVKLFYWDLISEINFRLLELLEKSMLVVPTTDTCLDRTVISSLKNVTLNFLLLQAVLSTLCLR